MFTCSAKLNCMCTVTLRSHKLYNLANVSNNHAMLISGPNLVPRPLPMREKGLVHTDCACARLYPESGYMYIVYSRKILSKLSFYDYVIFSIYLHLANKHNEASIKTSFERLTGKRHRRVLPRHLFELCHVVSYNIRTMILWKFYW